MFGQQGDQGQQDTTAVADEQTPGLPAVQTSNPTDDTISSDGQPSPQPDAVLDEEQIKNMISPAGGFPQRPNFQPPPGASTPISRPRLEPAAPTPPSNNDSASDDDTTHELIDIRQHALGELAPIIDQLELPPEEKFHTIMMVIQACDDQSMIKAAYDAAHSIEDEKARAQALLDIINEVNYFTKSPETGSQEA